MLGGTSTSLIRTSTEPSLGVFSKDTVFSAETINVSEYWTSGIIETYWYLTVTDLLASHTPPGIVIVEEAETNPKLQDSNLSLTKILIVSCIGSIVLCSL